MAFGWRRKYGSSHSFRCTYACKRFIESLQAFCQTKNNNGGILFVSAAYADAEKEGKAAPVAGAEDGCAMAGEAFEARLPCSPAAGATGLALRREGDFIHAWAGEDDRPVHLILQS